MALNFAQSFGVTAQFGKMLAFTESHYLFLSFIPHMASLLAGSFRQSIFVSKFVKAHTISCFVFGTQNQCQLPFITRLTLFSLKYLVSYSHFCLPAWSLWANPAVDGTLNFEKGFYNVKVLIAPWDQKLFSFYQELLVPLSPAFSWDFTRTANYSKLSEPCPCKIGIFCNLFNPCKVGRNGSDSSLKKLWYLIQIKTVLLMSQYLVFFPHQLQ